MSASNASGNGEPGTSAAPTFRGDMPATGGDEPFRLLDGPRHATHEDRSELPGHYEATFATTGGERFDRYLTDKGRAELLRLIDGGQQGFTREELEWLTTEPTIEALMASMAGEGAEGG